MPDALKCDGRWFFGGGRVALRRLSVDVAELAVVAVTRNSKDNEECHINPHKSNEKSNR